MIKLSGKNAETGRGVIILGIEEKNVERMKAGHPIHFIADELGFKGEIVIHYEPTMAKLEERFRSAIGPKTRVTDRSGDKRN